jgi:catechol 2,3-dioxygenase-like lactoylglutathione lyase family enzyme
MHIPYITLLVRDYDEAIRFFTQALGFTLLEDTVMSPSKRWVVVTPSGGGCGLLLAKASSEEQLARVGDQTGGRVFMFLHTDNFWRDYKRMKAHNVIFCEESREEEYGTVVVFQDLYGNKWDFIERKLPVAG